MATPRETDILTVAAVRSGDKKTGAEYLFNERQRIYVLGERARAGTETIRRLEQARADERPVKVVLNSKRGTIERISEPTDRELVELARQRPRLKKPAKIANIEVGRIDPTTFNFAELYLKWPTFRLCTRIVPSYAKAREIFDFCAQLSCNLPGPYELTRGRCARAPGELLCNVSGPAWRLVSCQVIVEQLGDFERTACLQDSRALSVD